MPCQVDPSYEREMDAQRYKKLKQEADSVTALLCAVMRQLEKREGDSIQFDDAEDTVDFSVKELFFDNIEGLEQWWKEHQRIDKERTLNEVISKVKNLTLEELEAVNKVLNKKE